MTFRAEAAKTVWDWVKTAPLPVVIAMMVGLAAWVYAIDNRLKAEVADVKITADSAKDSETKIEKIEGKVDDTNKRVIELGLAIARIEARQTNGKAAK